MGLAIALREDILNAVFRGTALPALPANYDVALLTTNPTDETGAGAVEVSAAVWTNYARQTIANTTAGFSAPPGGTTNPQSISNAAITNYGTAAVTGSAPVVVGFALYDHANPTVFQGWAQLSSAQTINNGDPVSFAVGALTISL